MNFKGILKTVSPSVVLASLCCLSPIIFVLLGVSSISAAASLTDILYGEYKWLFRGLGLISLSIALFIHIRKDKKICSLSQAKRRKNEIINTVLIALALGVIGYIFFLYIVVHYIGVFLNIWS